MEIQYFGGNCVKITTKKASVIVDDVLESYGLRPQTKANDIALFTTYCDSPKIDTKIIIDQPGEYEVSFVSIQGFGMRAHIDQDGLRNATMFKITAEDVKVLITGHIYPDLSDDQLEAIGPVDIVIIPVGGNGYTLDGVEALKLIKKIDPKIIIPVHYADEAIRYEVPQQELSQALVSLSMEPAETLAKLKVKSTDLHDAGTKLIVLERQ